MLSGNNQHNGAPFNTRAVFLDAQLSRKSPALPPSRAAASNIKNLTAFHPRRPRLEGRVRSVSRQPTSHLPGLEHVGR
ncbi:hypothetical protein E2C01_039399 [Portunus trituberculatus]|uniref:Uncharacterized protein n=1 Tax=Portunus trituberculatus TaxID=210409 RepID=A0A5B7FKL0_PORTR|nr:hypothetical protein [Portunus trituberculatus]